MRRIIILCLCLVLILGLAVSASAYNLGWEDYITWAGTDANGLPIVSVMFPNDHTRVNVYNGNTLLQMFDKSSVTYEFPANTRPRFRILPLGQSGTVPNKLILADDVSASSVGIRDGSHISLVVEVTANGVTLSNATFTYEFAFYDANEVYLSSQIVSQESGEMLPKSFGFNGNLQIPSGAAYMAIILDLNSFTTYSNAYTMGVNVSDLSLSGYLQYSANGNLDKVEDGIWGEFEPIVPDDMGPEDLDGIEENNRNFFAQMGSDVLDFFNYTLEHINDYVEPLLFVSALMSLIIDIPAFGWLLYLSACVGFVGLILGIAPTVLSYKSETTRARESVSRYIRTHPDRSQPIRQNGVNRFDVASAMRKSRR